MAGTPLDDRWNRRDWLVVAVSFLLVVILALLQLSGSSVGQYHRAYNGPTVEDPNVLFGQPRGIRSDEWVRWTPVAVAQSRIGSPEVNPNLRDGIDLSVLDPAPHGGWTAWFEPHNYLFQVGVPVEIAFAFRWWIVGWFAAVGAYAFARVCESRRVRTSLLFGGFVALSPIFHWWWQPALFVPVAAGFLFLVALAIAERNASQSPRRAAGAAMAGGFAIACAVMMQYPPFLVAACVPAGFYQLGRLVEMWRDHGRSGAVRRGFVPLALSSILPVGVLGGLLVSKADLITAIQSSEFPGDRVIPSGALTEPLTKHLLSSNLSWFLRSDADAAFHFLNQSEASNVILILPVLFLAGLFAVGATVQRRERVDATLLSLLIFTSWCGVWLFVDNVGFLFGPFQFSQIPIARFFLVLGMTQFLLLFRVGSHYFGIASEHRSARLPIAGGALIALFGLFTLWANLGLADHAPGFVTSRATWFVLTSLFVAGSVAVCVGLMDTGLALLCVVSALATFDVNPVYRGLEPLTDSPLIEEIRRLGVAEPESAWVIAGGITFENIPVAAGVQTVTGASPYTQVDWWRTLDSSDETDAVADRSAHVSAVITDAGSSIELRGVNHIELQFDPCSRFAETSDVGFVVSVAEETSPCLQLESRVAFERVSFQFYRVVDPEG